MIDQGTKHLLTLFPFLQDEKIDTDELALG